jgi:hypothetical protein
MLNRLRLWWLRRQLKSGRKAYSKYVDESKGEEREFCIHEAMDAAREQRDKILNLSSAPLRDKAESLFIPVPPLADKESWEEGYWPNSIRLNLEAQAKLRKAIREEQRERWGFVAFLLKEIATPLIGAIGAVMGLLAFLHAFKSK